MDHNPSPIRNIGHYEEQFFRMKTQRLEVQMQVLRQDNIVLVSRIKDLKMSEQFLIEQNKILMEKNMRINEMLEDHKLGRKSRNSQESSQEMEVILRDMRVLKNDHELVVDQLQEQNRSMKKKLLQLEEQMVRQKEVQKQNQCAIMETSNSNKALKQQLKQIHINFKQIEQQLTAVKDRNKQKFLQDSEVINKHLEIKIQNSNNIHQYEQSSITFRQNVIQENIIEIRNQQIKKLNELIQKKEKQIQQAHKLQQQQIQLLRMDNQGKKFQMKRLKEQIGTKNEEIKNQLILLKPLLDQKENYDYSEMAQRRASLTLLELFLKKYKIKVF